MRTLHLKNVKYEHQENDKEKKEIKKENGKARIMSKSLICKNQ